MNSFEEALEGEMNMEESDETCNICDFNSIRQQRFEIHISKYIGFVYHSVLAELQPNWGVLLIFVFGIFQFQNKSFFFTSEYLDIRRMSSS